MKKDSGVAYILDKSDSYPRAGESDAEFRARVQKRQDERRTRMSQNEPNVLGNSTDSLKAAAIELGYLQNV